MKRINYLLVTIVAMVFIAACNDVNFKKTKSGMLYKILPSGSKDSVVKEGDWLKLHFTQKLNDSLLNSTFGKMPIYQKVAPNQQDYNPSELYHLLKKGDSVVTVMLVDSILKKGIMQALPPFMKKGDRLTIGIRVVDVLRSDSAYQADSRIEMERDAPRARKEQEEQMAKARQEQLDALKKEELDLEKSGEITKQVDAMKSYLASKNIVAQQVGKGTFITIEREGTGALADSGKYITVQYVGRHLDTDSVFDKGSFTRQLGVGNLIIGLEDGLNKFKKGSKGVVYVTGFRAYGKNPPPNSPFKSFEPFKFEIEALDVSDTEPATPQAPPPPTRN